LLAGRKPPLTAEAIKQVVDKTLHEKPAAGTHWSSRKLAAATGLSYTSVQRIWKAHELKPHRVKTFKLSNDKRFVEKVQDIVGLYLDPPNKALVCQSASKRDPQSARKRDPFRRDAGTIFRRDVASASVPAEAARRDDCLEFSEIEVTDRLQRLGECAVLQVLR
jgi:hypothetical protein